MEQCHTRKRSNNHNFDYFVYFGFCKPARHQEVFATRLQRTVAETFYIIYRGLEQIVYHVGYLIFIFRTRHRQRRQFVIKQNITPVFGTSRAPSPTIIVRKKRQTKPCKNLSFLFTPKGKARIVKRHCLPLLSSHSVSIPLRGKREKKFLKEKNCVSIFLETQSFFFLPFFTAPFIVVQKMPIIDL